MKCITSDEIWKSPVVLRYLHIVEETPTWYTYLWACLRSPNIVWSLSIIIACVYLYLWWYTYQFQWILLNCSLNYDYQESKQTPRQQRYFSTSSSPSESDRVFKDQLSATPLMVSRQIFPTKQRKVPQSFDALAQLGARYYKWNVD